MIYSATDSFLFFIFYLQLCVRVCLRSKSRCCGKGKNFQQGKHISLHLLFIEAILIPSTHKGSIYSNWEQKWNTLYIRFHKIGASSFVNRNLLVGCSFHAGYFIVFGSLI
jgi:hypothetical protein